MTAKVGDLDHHAVVEHTVGGLEAAVDFNVAGVEVGHALDVAQRRLMKHAGCCSCCVCYNHHTITKKSKAGNFY